MFGSDIKIKFDTYIDEVGSDYLPDALLNILLNKAVNVEYDKEIKKYGLGQEITMDVQPFINITLPITPINATIDISSTSIAVADYYRFLALEMTCPYLTGSITKQAKESKFSQRISNYVKGTSRYPRYTINGNTVQLEPSNCTSAVVIYFTLPQVIDVTDTTTPIIYNNAFIEQIIDETMYLAGIKGRDTFIAQAGVQMETQS